MRAREPVTAGPLVPNPVTANSGHSSGGPFSAWLPRSANVIPDPATRSLTVRETRISAGRARAATRSVICTEGPDPRTLMMPHLLIVAWGRKPSG